MARFATGKNSYAISDRSGLRYRYKDMRKEWNGLLVGKDEYEPKHPQLEPYTRISDAIGLKDARPARKEPYVVYVGIPTVEDSNPVQIKATGSVGIVSLGGDVVTPIQLTGVSSTSALGSVTISASTSASTFDSTSVTLDATNKTFDEA
jgi:hypothetical protein|tara:strand:- start:3175 stop:3621 length:447 start_codon:yes stop_codon:yes gene_type:complete